MTFDGINVQHGKLEMGAGDVIKGATDIKTRLQTLEDELKPLASDWTGSAKEAYHEAKTKWDTAIDEMITLLRDAGGAVHDSNTEYKAADTRGAGRF